MGGGFARGVRSQVGRKCVGVQPVRTKLLHAYFNIQSPGNRQHMPYKVEWVERLHICIHDIKKVRDYFGTFFRFTIKENLDSLVSHCTFSLKINRV